MPVLACLALAVAACAQGASEIAPPEIRYGEDLCAACNMIINEARFAAGYAYEIAPGRYQSLAFDDIGDMLGYAGNHPEHDIVAWFVHDYITEAWLDATVAFYVISSAIATPMGHGMAAFADLAEAQAMAQRIGGDVLDWTELQAQ